MVCSIVELKPALIQTLSDLPEVGTEFTANDWDLMRKIIRVLKPFEEETRKLSKQDASISTVIPFVTMIIKSLEDTEEDRGVLTWKRALKKNIETRFSEIESQKHYTMATILDSRYKHFFYRNPDTYLETKNQLIEEMIQVLRAQDTQSQQVLCNAISYIT